VTPPLVQATGFGAYVFFAVFCGLSMVWTYCELGTNTLFLTITATNQAQPVCVPETNGITLEKMDEVFKDRSNAADAAEKSRILAEVLREKREALVGEKA
jgi:hypothetical protein